MKFARQRQSQSVSQSVEFLLVAMFAVVTPFMATSAAAQGNGPFKHIIIVVQENRTPDNLFGSNPIGIGCSGEHPFETGVDIVDGGYGWVPQSDGTSYIKQIICNMSLPLNGWDAAFSKDIDPPHGNVGWVNDHLGYVPGKGYNTNYLDTGFCYPYSYKKFEGTCPSYSFVQQSDVQPYFDIATNYGFANYMFQSNEGMSYAAHQFLFTGTSAPVAPGDPNKYDWDFVLGTNQLDDTGCSYIQLSYPQWIKPDGTWINPAILDECYTHDSLVTTSSNCNGGQDSCDRGFSWAWYASPDFASIWNAPLSIPEVCYGQNSFVGGNCVTGQGTEYSDHMRIPNQNGRTYAPIFDDLYNCNLPAISWVIPDGYWSDHPQNNDKPQYGPSWVGDIIDAVGNSWQNGCGIDYWGYPTHQGATPEPTAIFVVWDDWGGWYDHIAPWNPLRQGGGTGFTDCDEGGSEQYGCGYTDSYRVPLLVVSEYTPNYVSGACGTGEQNQCPYYGQNNNSMYVHDFGSILAYTEWNFGFNPEFIAPPPGYADYNAPDWGPQRNNVPLSDFFGLWTPPNSNPRKFVSITTPYGYTCFQKPGSCWSWTAGPPDTDVDY